MTPEERREIARQRALKGQIPEGVAIHYEDGITEYPHTGVRYDRGAQHGGQNPVPLEVAGTAARKRNYSAEHPVLGVYDPLNNPYAIGYLSGFTFGGTDEAIRNPVARETFRQSYDQAGQDRPYVTLAGEITGGVGSALTAGKALGGTRLATGAANLMTRGSTAAQIGKGAALGAGAVAGEAALTARPGQRLGAATDPVGLAVGTILGGSAIPAAKVYGVLRDLYEAGKRGVAPIVESVSDAAPMSRRKFLKGAGAAAAVGAGVAAKDLPYGMLAKDIPVASTATKLLKPVALTKEIMGRVADYDLADLGRDISALGGKIHPDSIVELIRHNNDMLSVGRGDGLDMVASQNGVFKRAAANPDMTNEHLGDLVDATNNWFGVNNGDVKLESYVSELVSTGVIPEEKANDLLSAIRDKAVDEVDEEYGVEYFNTDKAFGVIEGFINDLYSAAPPPD